MTAPVDPTLDRLFRHEPWVLRKVFAHLRALPEETLRMTASHTDWDVAETLIHIVGASEAYAARIDGRPEPPDEPGPRTHAELAALEPRAIAAAERLRQLAGEGSDETVTEEDGGRTFRYPRSVVLAQSIYHAIEHRAQLFAILSANGVKGLTLDDLDHWTVGVAEGVLEES